MQTPYCYFKSSILSSFFFCYLISLSIEILYLLLLCGNKCSWLQTLTQCARDVNLHSNIFLEICPKIKQFEPFEIAAWNPCLTRVGVRHSSLQLWPRYKWCDSGFISLRHMLSLTHSSLAGGHEWTAMCRNCWPAACQAAVCQVTNSLQCRQSFSV